MSGGTGSIAADLRRRRTRASHPEIVGYFLRLGTLGFWRPGGAVRPDGARTGRRESGWLTQEEMRDAIAVCQSLPGPLAIQVGIFIAYHARRLLGRLGRRLGLHPAELHDRFRAWARSTSISAVCSWMTAIFYGVSPA